MSFTFPVVTFAKARMAERLKDIEMAKAQGKKPELLAGNRRGDLLSMFLKAKEDRPDFFHDGRVLTMAVSMAFAGSETTAISLAAVFYYLLKNPWCYQKLMQELGAALESGTLENRPSGITTWAESQKLPYLDACIKEAFRLHPAPGLVIERIVPKQGAEICGEHIPGGTIVGCNAWVIHRRPEIFGDDVEAFRPERWLDASPDVRKKMDGSMLQFGMGARTCIGKNISLLEIYKLVPSFLRRFEVRLLLIRTAKGRYFHEGEFANGYPQQVQLANPEKEWRLHNAWFVKQLDFNTTFRPRSGTPMAVS